MSQIEERLQSLGIEIPKLLSPRGNYVCAVTQDKLVFLSGAGPLKADGTFIVGRVPIEISAEEAYEAARLTGLNILANLKAEIGTLDRVKRVVKVLRMVNSENDFKGHPKVAYGFSELMVKNFGEAGRGARSAVGMGYCRKDNSRNGNDC